MEIFWFKLAGFAYVATNIGKEKAVDLYSGSMPGLIGSKKKLTFSEHNWNSLIIASFILLTSSFEFCKSVIRITNDNRKLGLNYCGVKPRWNNDNHGDVNANIGTLLGATCCVRLATLLRRDVTCWVLFGQIGEFFCAIFVDVVWFCRGLAKFVQHSCAWAGALVQFSTCNMPQHVATGWPNTRNMLRP